jgi:replication factor C large subunit
MTAGVAMARINTRASGWIPFRFPQRIKMLSKSKAERSMALNIGYKIKRRCHISAVKASKEVIPYLKIIFKNNFKMAAGLAKWFNLPSKMIEYLTEDEKKAESITKLMN